MAACAAAARLFYDAIQRRDFQAFFDKGIQRQIFWRGAADGEVVDGAVNRQRADVATRKLQRLDDEAVGGHVRLAAFAEIDRRGVERDVQCVGTGRIGQVPRKNLRDEFPHVASAIAVRQADVFI